jgi:hypothetical protein
LRVLLLLFTALAIGLPICYRWPYEEELADVLPRSLADPFDRLPSDDPFGPPPTRVRRITTWQRQWGGDKLKHGVERHVGTGGSRSTTYRLGKRHGPYLEREVMVSRARPRTFTTGQTLSRQPMTKQQAPNHNQI